MDFLAHFLSRLYFLNALAVSKDSDVGIASFFFKSI